VTNSASGGEDLGPLTLPADDNVVQYDYSIPSSGAFTADISCTVGTVYGRVSQSRFCHVTNATPVQISEAVFFAGQLLETAPVLDDPLLLELNGGPPPSSPALSRPRCAGGQVRLLSGQHGGGPMLIQVFGNSRWSSLGIFTPDASGYYWVSYPACVIGPMPPFQGCPVTLPDNGAECAHHV